MRMRAQSTLILLVCESCRRLGLGVTVVVARLIWRGVAVISSRRPGLVRVRLLLPLIHGKRRRGRQPWRCSSAVRVVVQQAVAVVQPEEHKASHPLTMRSGILRGASDSRTRRSQSRGIRRPLSRGGCSWVDPALRGRLLSVWLAIWRSVVGDGSFGCSLFSA